MATNEDCTHNQKVNLPAVRNRIEKSGFDKFCGMCALDSTAQNCSAGALWLCLSCGSQLCEQDMKWHALVRYGAPGTSTDVHAMAMNTDTFAVRCYCCNVPVEPYADTPLLEIVEYCLAKAVDTRGTIKPPVRSWFRVRGLSGEDDANNAPLQCMARTPFLLTMLKKEATSKSRVDVPGGTLKFFDGQEIQLPMMENLTLQSYSRVEKLYALLNELISGDNVYVSMDGFKDDFWSLKRDVFGRTILNITSVDARDRSEIEQLIARTFYRTEPNSKFRSNSGKMKRVLDFYLDQLRCRSTAYCYTTIFRGTFVEIIYCSCTTRSVVKHLYLECEWLSYESSLKKLFPEPHQFPERQENRTCKCTKYSVTLIVEPPPVLILQSYYRFFEEFSYPFALDVTQYYAPNVLLEQKQIVYALYGLIFRVPSGKHAAYVKVRQPLGTDDARWKFLSQHSKDDLQTIADRVAAQWIAQKKTNCYAPPQENSEVLPPPGKWYYILNSDVREVPDSQVLMVQPSILFYERIV